MGLDMYLRAEKYVSGYGFADEEEQRIYRTLVGEMGVADAVDPETPSATVSFTVAYWRKANAIHRWFVENVQGGEDECRPFYVDREQLVALRTLCLRVLEGGEVEVVGAEHLPTTAGFFFGSTDYDEWYVADLKATVAQIDRALTLSASWSFEYQSSW